MNSRACLLLDATRLGRFEIFQFRALSKALEALLVVILLVNKKSAENDGLVDEEQYRVVRVSDDMLFGSTGNVKGVDRLIPGNPDIKLLAAMEDPRLSEYDHFIRMEYDVVTAPKIEKSIGKLLDAALNHDFVSVNNFERADGDEIPLGQRRWPWWDSLRNRLDPGRPTPGPLRGGLLQIMALNRAYEAHYRAALAAGWTGHYEVLMPSVANWLGLKTFSLRRAGLIEGAGFAVKAPATFATTKGAFYHPVKSIDAFAQLPTAVIQGYLEHTEQVPSSLLCYRDLRMSADEVDFLKKYLRRSDRYLEFGCGGSTALACRMGVQRVVTIETDASFMLSIAKRHDLDSFFRLGRLEMRHIDIGRTGAWGAPVEPFNKRRWHRYLDIPWREISPDILLIDGRFRVAVAAQAYVNLHAAEKPPTVLVHDFDHHRPHYSPILEFLEPIETMKSMVAMRMKPGMKARALAVLDAHREDTR